MKAFDPIIETAIGTHARENRALVFLDRAAWMLAEAECSLASSAGTMPLRSAIEELRMLTARAAHDLAAHVCDREPYPGQSSAVPAAREV